MNYFFLVEGKNTEVDAYPRFIEHFVDGYYEVSSLDDLDINNYIIESGYGYPSIFNIFEDKLLKIAEFNKKNKHVNKKVDTLVLVIDADNYKTPSTAKKSVEQRISDKKDIIKDAKISVRYIVQNLCIESWFLGNKNAFPKSYDDEFKKYVEHFNVKQYSPEKMHSPISGITDAQYSYKYLAEMLHQSGMIYGKSKTQFVTSPNYIDGINDRYASGDIQSFKELLDIFKLMKNTYTKEKRKRQ